VTVEEPRIEAWMPTAEVATSHERTVAASPEDAYAAIRRTDLAASPTVRLLFAARGLIRPGPRPMYTLDGFIAAGFTLLEEIPGREIVLGLTGRFWRPTGGLVRLTPEEFTAFAEPGWAQAVWNFRVTPAPQGTRLLTETRVRTTDLAARRAFRRYWRIVGPFSAVIRRRALDLIAAEAERAEAG
jgi:hypothetical protein